MTSAENQEYSRPFKRRLLQIAKTPDKKAMLNGVRFVEDFTHNDFEVRKKALPIMQKAFEEGKKVKFAKGKLYVEGNGAIAECPGLAITCVGVL